MANAKITLLSVLFWPHCRYPLVCLVYASEVTYMLKCVITCEKNEKQIEKGNKTYLPMEYLTLKVCLVLSYFHFCYHF